MAFNYSICKDILEEMIVTPSGVTIQKIFNNLGQSL